MRFDHEVVDELHLLLILLLVPVHFLNHDADTIETKGEDSTGEEHGNISASQLDTVGGSDIAVANGDHSHGGPIKGQVVPVPNGHIRNVVIVEPVLVFVVVVGHSMPHTGENMADANRLHYQVKKVEKVTLTTL